MSNQPEVSLDFSEPQFGGDERGNRPTIAPRFEDLWGTIRLVTAVPSWTPRGRLEDSIALYISGATYRLYVYDYSNAAWRYASLT